MTNFKFTYQPTIDPQEKTILRTLTTEKSKKSACSSYLFGYQGSEKDDEIFGSTGTAYTTQFRGLDTRIVRWWSVDPKTNLTPWESPYASMGLNPILYNDPNGDYFVGIFGQKTKVRVKKNGNIKVGLFASKDVRRMASLINKGGSITAHNQFMKLANNPTKIHFKIVKNKVNNDFLGLHSVYDKKGNQLKWNENENKFVGQPAYIKDNGFIYYKEAKIEIFEGNIKDKINKVIKLGIKLDFSSNDEIISNFGHEAEHDLDQEGIKAIKNNNQNYDVEGKPELIQMKIDKELKQNKKK